MECTWALWNFHPIDILANTKPAFPLFQIPANAQDLTHTWACSLKPTHLFLHVHVTCFLLYVIHEIHFELTYPLCTSLTLITHTTFYSSAFQKLAHIIKLCLLEGEHHKTIPVPQHIENQANFLSASCLAFQQSSHFPLYLSSPLIGTSRSVIGLSSYKT